MNRLTSAYVAGLIDGEGCIYISKSKQGGKAYYAARVDVGMTEKAGALLEVLKEQYGGSVNLTRKATDKWDAAMRWSSHGRSCLVFLRKIGPHLVLKSEQARLAMVLQDMIAGLCKRKNGSAIWTEKARQNANCLRIQIQELNRKGPSAESAPGWFARHVGGLWLTPQRDMFSEVQWEQFSETWPQAGMMRSGRVYRRPQLVPRTSVTGSSLWRTPYMGSNRRGTVALRSIVDQLRQGEVPTRTVFLSDQVKLWPTPRSHEVGSYQYNRGDPTKKTLTLTGAARLWPTPAARDYKGEGFSGQLPTEMAGGQLNAEFVEWLMGFPRGWTDLTATNPGIKNGLGFQG